MHIGGKAQAPRKRTHVKPIISSQCNFPRTGRTWVDLACRWGEALTWGQAQELRAFRTGSRSEHDAGSESGQLLIWVAEVSQDGVSNFLSSS